MREVNAATVTVTQTPSSNRWAEMWRIEKRIQEKSAIAAMCSEWVQAMIHVVLHRESIDAIGQERGWLKSCLSHFLVDNCGFAVMNI